MYEHLPDHCRYFQFLHLHSLCVETIQNGARTGWSRLLLCESVNLRESDAVVDGVNLREERSAAINSRDAWPMKNDCLTGRPGNFYAPPCSLSVLDR